MNYLQSHPDESARSASLSLSGHSAAQLIPYQLNGSELTVDVPSSRPLDYSRILRRHALTLLLAAALGAAAGCLSTILVIPVYQARASLEIQGINENFLDMRDMNPNSGASFTPEVDLQTQVKVIQSQAVIEKAIHKLDGEKRSIPKPARSFLERTRTTLGFAQSKQPAAKSGALQSLAEDLKVRVQPNTRLVEVLFDSTDPRSAADFTNALVAAYIEQNREARWQTIQNTGEWLATQMRALKAKLEKGENELKAYGKASGLQMVSGKENVAEEKLRQLQEELSRAQGDRIGKQSKYELAVSAAPEQLPEVLDNAVLKDYQVKLAEIRSQLADLSPALTPDHPKVVRLEAQAASLQSALEKERANILGRIQNEYQAARRRETLLESDRAAQTKLLADQTGKTTHYDMLKRDVDTTRLLYDTMVQRVNEAGIASALGASNIRVIDSAVPPRTPYKPSVPMNAFVGLLLGTFVGFLFVVHGERSDHSIHEPGEASAYLNASELGVIPSGDSVPGYKRYLPAGASGAQRPRMAAGSVLAFSNVNAGADGQGSELPILAARRDPSSFGDSFRAAMTSILFSGQNGDRPHVIVVTSTNAGEGKTTVVCNLAITLAEVGQRVLLIDGDLWRHRLHELFGMDNRAGLSDLLSESGPVPALGQKTSIPNLHVLPCGATEGANLLYSPRLAELLAMARKQSDVVLIDTPPMFQMPEARVFGRVADGVILVIRAGHAPLESLLLARQRLADDGTRFLGTILNDWSPRDSDTPGYKQSYESSQRYYSKT